MLTSIETCPRCGSGWISREKQQASILRTEAFNGSGKLGKSGITLGFSGAGLETVFRCRKCGHVWKRNR